MENIDDVIEQKVYSIENLVRGLIIAFPAVRYVALNPNITMKNDEIWSNEWYAVGFTEQPYMTVVDGYYAWVKSPDINSGVNEDAEFFLHFNSDGWYFNDWLLQKSISEIQNETELCFYINDNNEVVQYKDEDHILLVEPPSENNDDDDLF